MAYIKIGFYLQLVVFAGAAFYTRSTNGGITAVADTSIGLSLTVFLAVVEYHVFCLISSLRQAHRYRLKGYVNVEEYVHDRVDDGSTVCNYLFPTPTSTLLDEYLELHCFFLVCLLVCTFFLLLSNTKY